MKTKKGQLFSLDMLIGISIGILMLSFAFLFWNIHSNEINLRESRKEMQAAAFDASNKLVKIELVDKSNVLSPSKILNFISIPYNQTKKKLGLGGYDFHLNIKNENGEILEINSTPIKYGKNSTNSTEVVVVKRICVIGENITILSLEAWR